jgi:hypothetical protein
MSSLLRIVHERLHLQDFSRAAELVAAAPAPRPIAI